MAQKILLTGTGGFILSNFVRKATYSNKDKRYEFASLDCLNYNNKGTVYINKGHSFYMANILDSKILDRIFEYEKPSIVIHGASANIRTNTSEDVVKTNVVGTQNIIEACQKYDVKKLMYLSSDRVYGPLPDDKILPPNEGGLLKPNSLLSASYIGAEALIQVSGLNYNILRGAHCYGGRQSSDKLIPRTVMNLLNGNRQPIFHGGLQIRDYMHVFDFITALMMILERGEDSSIYNVGSEQEWNTLEVVNEICKFMGKSLTNSLDFVQESSGKDEFRYATDISKLKDLGWSANYRFKRDVGPECVQWFINNKAWGFAQ